MLGAATIWLAERLFEVATMRGARVLLRRVLREPTLRLIDRRFYLRVPERHHHIRAGEAERTILFYVEYSNPTPHRLHVTSRRTEILYQDVVVGSWWSDAVEQISPEVQNRLLEVAVYNPFLFPLGLPETPKGWKIRGWLDVQGYYGAFRRGFVSPIPVTVEDSGTWDETRGWVDRRITEMRGR